MKRITLLLIVVLLSISTPVYARIGETPDQCVSRYGPCQWTEGVVNGFIKGDYGIYIIFYEHIAGTVLYANLTPDPKKENYTIHLTEKEIKNFLKVNSNSEWVKTIKVSLDSEWITKDGKLRALYSNEDRTLQIDKWSVYQARVKEEKEAEANKQKGF